VSTELENDLRDALHARAATITPDRLRRSAAPHRSVRRPPGAWVAAAALVLAAIVAVGFAVLGGKGSGDRVAAAGNAPDLRGTAWSVVAVTIDGKRQPIASPDVYVVFHIDHRFGGNENINYHGGRWRQSGDRLIISDVITTAVGYGGHDPAVLAAERGIGALDGDVRVGTQDGHLRLTAGGVVVELSRRSDLSTGAIPSGTPSPTLTGNAPGSYVNGSELAPAPNAS